MRFKNLFFLAFVIVPGFSIAQTFALKAGVNFANISTESDGQVNDAKQLTSFHAGIIGVFPLGTRIVSLQPGVFYTGKGAKTTVGTVGSANYVKATFNPQYIEVPVNLVFTFPLGSKNGVFVGAGPYGAIGVAGKSKIEGSLAGAPFNSEEKIEWSNDDPTTGTEEGAGFGIIRRFDYGLNGLAGIEVQKVKLSVGYGYGLAKLQSGSNSSSNDANKHRVLSLSLGYRF